MLSHPVKSDEHGDQIHEYNTNAVSEPPRLANNADKLTLTKDSGLSPTTANLKAKEGSDCQLRPDFPQHLFINPANQDRLQPEN